jgi:hypothetical protein
MKGLFNGIFFVFALQAALGSLCLQTTQAEALLDTTKAHPGNIWPGTLRCHYNAEAPNEFFPLSIYCQEDIGFGREQDIIDRDFLKKVSFCCEKNRASFIEVDCTIVNKRRPEDTDVTRFPCS